MPFAFLCISSIGVFVVVVVVKDKSMDEFVINAAEKPV
jgi:hypothetical protein